MPKPDISERVMPFGEHLEELRRRLILAIVGCVPLLILSLVVGRRLLELLLKPLEEAMLKSGVAGAIQITSPFEYFNAYLKLSLVLTVVLGAPWIIYQLWLFIAPGLYATERRFIHLLAPLSVALSVAGVGFLYFVMLPVMLGFFVLFNASLPRPAAATAPLPAGVVLPALPSLEMDPENPATGTMWFNRSLGQLRIAVAKSDGATERRSDQQEAQGARAESGANGGAASVLGVALFGDSLIQQQYKVSEYLGMVLGFALALVLAFQMPVVVLLLGWAGVLQLGTLTKYRRHAAMVCLVLGAVLTPADPFTMFVLAVPLYLLYELGVVLLRALPRERVAGGAKDSLRPAGAPSETSTAAKTDTSGGEADGEAG